MFGGALSATGDEETKPGKTLSARGPHRVETSTLCRHRRTHRRAVGAARIRPLDGNESRSRWRRWSNPQSHRPTVAVGPGLPSASRRHIHRTSGTGTGTGTGTGLGTNGSWLTKPAGTRTVPATEW